MEDNCKINKVLILGAKGNLGRQVVDLLKEKEKDVVIEWTRHECDVTDLLAVEEGLRKIRPDIVINTVAYNDVDSCENELSEQKKAIILNIGLVERLAFVCRDINAKLVHFSTNYVFSGEKEYYCEEDITSPINFYGLTKCLGEEAVLYAIDSGLKATIIRVSNLFGPQGVGESSKPSFFDSILKVAKTSVKYCK